jgi:thiol-disulfide isomerase/thioredoxin
LVLVLGSLLAISAILVAFVLAPSGAEEEAARAEEVTNPAPEVELVDFNGETLRLSDFRGTPVVLNFWASWCPPCIAEMPDFERVNQTVGDRVMFIGVNFQDDPDQAARLAVETGVTYLLVRDPQGLIFQQFDGLGMPTTVFIDASGSVREVVTGQMSESQLRAKIAEYFSTDL